jgi:hypothetical protein
MAHRRHSFCCILSVPLLLSKGPCHARESVGDEDRSQLAAALTAPRLRALHRAKDIGSVLKGGVNICQRASRRLLQVLHYECDLQPTTRAPGHFRKDSRTWRSRLFLVIMPSTVAPDSHYAGPALARQWPAHASNKPGNFTLGS